MTSASAVVAAVECGVDAIGFVFAPSPRRVTPVEARELARQAPADLLRVAVTQHPQQPLLDEIFEYLQPAFLQTDITDLASIVVPPDVHVRPVLRAGEPTPDDLPARLLFEGPVSGSGTPGDWRRARELAERSEVILAGGLRPDNVGDAIARVRPFGV